MSPWIFALICNNDASFVVLADEPIDWESYRISLKRHSKYHGMVHEMTNELTFWGEGYEFIKEKYEAFGPQVDIVMGAETDCDGTIEYLPMVRMNVSSPLTFNEGDQCTITVSFEEASCTMQFTNRKGVDVDVLSLSPIDDPGSDSLTDYDGIDFVMDLPPKAIIQRIDYQISDGIVESGTFEEDKVIGNGVGSASIHSLSYWHLGYSNILIDDFTGAPDLTRYDFAADVPPLFIVGQDGDYDFDLSLSVIVRMGVDTGINVDIPGCAGPPAGLTDWNVILVLEINGTTITLDNQSLIATCRPATTDCVDPDSDVYSTPGPIAYSATHSLIVGDVVRLYALVEFGAITYRNLTLADQQIHFCHEIELAPSDSTDQWFKASFLDIYAATPGRVSLVNEVLSRIVEIYTSDCLRVKSDYFGRTDSLPYDSDEDGCGSLEAITNGLLIRQIHTAQFFENFNHLYDGLDAIHCLGMGIEDDADRPGFQCVRIEKAISFYPTSVIGFAIEHPTTIQRTVVTEQFYTKLNIGYLKWEAGEANGLDEFCTKRQYSVKQTQLGGEKNVISGLIASGYAIEYTRRYGRITNDWKYDNDKFIIDVQRTYDSYEVVQDNISSPANLIDPPTVYNFRLSPARNALRWKEFLFNIFNNNLSADAALMFASGEGNYLAEGLLNDTGCIPEADVLSESETLTYDDAVDDDSDPRRSWERWTFTYPMDIQEFQTVKADFYGLLPVTWGNNTTAQHGYIELVEWSPAQGLAKFTIIKQYEAIPPVGEFYLLQINGDLVLQIIGDKIILN